MDIEKLRYPIGKFIAPQQISSQMRQGYLHTLENLPSQMHTKVLQLSEKQIDTPYRPDGWTIRQVVHHVADSHLNAYIRTRWTLTEDFPTIKAYNEVAWAELEDAKTAPVSFSLEFLAQIHRRWIFLLKNLKESDFEKAYFHPETKKKFSLNDMLALYDWHSKHHLGHIDLIQ